MNVATQAGERLLLRGMNPKYPWSDGQPMAENSVQYRWITTIHGNLEGMFRDRPDVFVAADNLIYPVEHHPEICQAPDTYVAFGVPKEDRGSFLVFEEGGVFPQVVFEVRSPSNSAADMTRKLEFYGRYGAEEYYDFDPARNRMRAYHRIRGQLEEIDDLTTWVSARLGIWFDLSGPEMVIYHPDGKRFLTRAELAEQAEQAEAEGQRATRAEKQATTERRRATRAEKRAEQERQRAEQERQRAEQERQRAEQEKVAREKLAAKLRELGVDPDAV